MSKIIVLLFSITILLSDIVGSITQLFMSWAIKLDLTEQVIKGWWLKYKMHGFNNQLKKKCHSFLSEMRVARCIHHNRTLFFSSYFINVPIVLDWYLVVKVECLLALATNKRLSWHIDLFLSLDYGWCWTYLLLSCCWIVQHFIFESV